MSINTTKICDDLEIADEGTTVIAYNKNNPGAPNPSPAHP